MAVTLLLFYTLISISQAEKILGIFPTPANSVFTFTNAVCKSLAEGGHEITIITSFPSKAAKENYTSIIDVSKGETIYISQSSVEEFSGMTVSEFVDFRTNSELSFCEKIMNLKEIQKILKSEKPEFDAIFIERGIYHQCYSFIGKKYNIPVITALSARSWTIGDLQTSNPSHPALIPPSLSRTTNHKSFYDRLENTQVFLQIVIKYYWDAKVKKILNPFYQKYVKNYMSFEEFMEIEPAMHFVNSHSSYFPRPMNLNVIEIGGITTTENKPLPREIQAFLDGAKHGAILFTFGSLIRAAKVSKNKIQAFMDAFAEIPQRVIWKYEEPLEGVSENVMLMKWVPQTDILAHKNVKAFISHCGQGAIHETLHNGVPLISCPLIMDQLSNANLFENLEIAVHLDFETITKQTVSNALNEIINNTKYYEKMQKLSTFFKDRPMSPKETVVFWSEYVMRHKGASHLRSPANDLSWFQYLLLDVICFVIFIFFVILFVIYFIYKRVSRFIIKLFCGNTTKSKIL